MIKTLCVFGTRPEAIKMAPLIKVMQDHDNIDNKVCTTGQHSEMLGLILNLFNIKPNFSFSLMKDNQDLSLLMADIIIRLNDVFKQDKPDLVIVHGDTSTALAATIGAYYNKIPVAHVEAGLRTSNINSPWPEEGNRQLIDRIASLCFAPTEISKNNLIHEGIDPDKIYVTGNTIIDALTDVLNTIDKNDVCRAKFHDMLPFLNKERRIILVTCHRRESFGPGFLRICKALAKIAQLFPMVDIIYPVHLNPNVQKPVNQHLSNFNNIYLIAPLDYLSFIYLMKWSYIILTDSGGIQEEAPSLGKPLLLMRDTTERPEAIDNGNVMMVGTSVNKIVTCTSQLLNDKQVYLKMSHAKNPYGDGHAASMIAQIISQYKE